MEHLRTIVIAAERHGGFVRIDMDGSALIDQTLDVFEHALADGHRNVGVVLQSYLYRTAAGYGARVYVPFGSEWFPFFMRRLAECPSNVGFIIRSALYEQHGK